MDWSPVHKVSALAFLIGVVFGAIANKTNFCTMGAVSDWVNMGDKNRLRAWLLAIGLAIVATQAMRASGLIELQQAIYLTPNFGWLGYLLGGLLFGVGMTLASGCGQRTLVRVGGGNLKSLIVIVLTTSNDEKDVLTAYGLNSNAYITKPVDLDQFFDVVKSIEHFFFTVVTLPPA